MLNYIRVWDKAAADRVDYFIANSTTVKRRISKYYKSKSRVIYPPVETNIFKTSEIVGDYFLIGARLSPYKRFDIVIEAFKRTNLKLKIFGSGVDEKRLREIAGDAKNIEFLGRVTDEEKAKLYSECRAFINPQDEDFGITAVEAMASGRPVIAFRKGGATETVIEGKTGEFFNEQSIDSFQTVLETFNHKKYNSREIREHALKFSIERFKKEIKDFVEEKITDFKK